MAIHLDLARLRCFAVVAEELSFTRAAARLQLAQPWVSNQIRRLEEELGFALFKRSTRSVELTRTGQQFLPQVYRVLRSEQQTRAAAIALRRSEVEELRVGMPSHLAVTLRYPAVARMIEEWSPAVHVHSAPSVDLLPALERGDLDVAFLSAPLATDGLVTHKLEEGNLVLLVPENHVLARHEVVPAEALLDQRVLTFGRHHNNELWDCHVGGLANTGATLVEAPEPSASVMFRAAPASGLPTLTHPWTAEWMGAAMGMVTRRIEGDPCGYTVLLARRRGPVGPRLSAFWDAAVAGEILLGRAVSGVDGLAEVENA